VKQDKYNIHRFGSGGFNLSQYNLNMTAGSQYQIMQTKQLSTIEF